MKYLDDIFSEGLYSDFHLILHIARVDSILENRRMILPSINVWKTPTLSHGTVAKKDISACIWASNHILNAFTSSQK